MCPIVTVSWILKGRKQTTLGLVNRRQILQGSEPRYAVAGPGSEHSTGERAGTDRPKL